MFCCWSMISCLPEADRIWEGSVIVKGSVFIAASLDGFIARENGDIDWLTRFEGGGTGEDYGFKAFLDTVDVLVMGRHTFEKVVMFHPWPYGIKPVVVLGTSSVQIPEPLSHVVTWKSGNPTDIVRELSEQGAKHLYIDGGKTIQGFLNAGLIQRMTITRIPVLLGRGIPLFGPTNRDVTLRCMDTRQYTNGLVQSTYEVI